MGRRDAHTRLKTQRLSRNRNRKLRQEAGPQVAMKKIVKKIKERVKEKFKKQKLLQIN